MTETTAAATPGQRIIESLKQAVAGDFARIRIDGQVWERVHPPTSLQNAQTTAAPPSPRVPSEEEIARVLWIADGDGRSEEDWQLEMAASGEALEVQSAFRQARAVLALFTPHQGEG